MILLLDKINILLIITALLNFFLGVIIFFHGYRKKINIVYSFNIISIISWILAMVFFRSASAENSLFWVIILYISPTPIASSFLYFTHIFPIQTERINQLKKLLILIANLVIIGLLLTPNLIIREVLVRSGQEKLIMWGPAYFLYAIYIFSFFSLGFIKLFKKYIKSKDKVEKRQIIYLVTGYAIAANLAMVTNLFMPWIGRFELNWLGQVFTIFMVVFATYAILKHHLFNIKVIATEIFSTLLVVVTLVQVFLSKSPQELVYKLALFAAVLIFAVLLIRSVLAEVRRREELQKLSDRLGVANIKLKDANRHLKELLKMKSEFLSIASHQLRTPLSALRGLLDMQVKGDFDRFPETRRKELQKDMLLSANRLNNIVNDLLDALEVEGGLQLEFKPVDVIKTIEEVIKTLKFNYDKKKLYLKFEKPTNLPKIEAEERYLREIFMNLIDNAEKYTEEGGTTVTVKPINDKIEVRVKDTGVGITDEDKMRLFEKFSRGKKAALIHTDGSGLGLFIVKKIVEEHHGTIKFESEGLGRGTTFIVNLPIRQLK